VHQWRVAPPSIEETIEWIEDNRYVRELTCEEKEQYRFGALCEATPTP